MLDSVRHRTGTSGRVAALIASMLAMVLVFVVVLRTTGDSAPPVREPGPLGASIERGDFDALPFGKLIEEGGGQEASEKSESKLVAAAPSSVDFDALALVGRAVGEWERPSVHRARVLLGVVGARGPPVG